MLNFPISTLIRTNTPEHSPVNKHFYSSFNATVMKSCLFRYFCSTDLGIGLYQFKDNFYLVVFWSFWAISCLGASLYCFASNTLAHTVTFMIKATKLY